MRDDAQGITYTFSTVPTKPLIFQGPNGYSRKGEGPTLIEVVVSGWGASTKV